MATLINDPANAPKTISAPGRKSKYDWDNLLNGQMWQLFEGEDYTSRASFRSAAYNEAKTRNLKVAVHTVATDDDEPGSMLVQAAQVAADEVLSDGVAE